MRSSRQWWSSFGQHALIVGMIVLALLLPDHATSTRVVRPFEPAAPVVVTFEHGQPDRDVIHLMPELDLRSITEAEPAVRPPVLAAKTVPQQSGGLLDGKQMLDMAEVVGAEALPDTLLVYSGDWFGEKLRRAADAMNLQVTARQLELLEVIAVARSVNTRLLLVAASVTNAHREFTAEQAWMKWLYLEAARIRMALGPFEATETLLIRFGDGAELYLKPQPTNAAELALTTIFAAGNTPEETTNAVADFKATYATHFGNPAIDEAIPAASAPFLIHPYRVPLTGIGYFDHMYPTVDYGKVPNIPGMLNYLGQTKVNYDGHDADDFWIPYGSDVYAPVSGPVLWVDSQAVLIGHTGDTYQIYIGHLSQRFVDTGAFVTQGQLIGKSGVANNVAHIHVEVRHNGKQTDTKGWYGGGVDPCPGAAPTWSYKGCEASTWLWADEAPPAPQVLPHSVFLANTQKR